MSSYKKLLSNTFLMIIGQFANKALSFLLVPLYTSILSTGEYGTFDLITTTVSLLSPVLTMVVSDAVMRFCLDENYSKPQILTIGLSFVALGTAVLLASYPIISMVDVLAGDFWWLMLFFVTSNTSTVLTQYLKGVEKIKLYIGCSVFSTLCTLLLNILFLAVFRWGIVGYMLAMSCPSILVIIIIFITEKLWKSLVNPFKIAKQVYRDILRFTVPMIPNSMSWWISNSSDKYMIRWFVSVSAVGLYSVSYKIPSILTVFTSIFISAFQISSVEDFGSERSRNFFSNVYKGYSALNNVVAAGCVAFAGIIAKILFQQDFFEAWKTSCILIVAYVFNTLAAFLGTIYTASKKTSFLFTSTVTAALLNVLLNFVLIKLIGINGAAIATLVSYACVWLVRLIHSRKILPMAINLWTDLASYVLLGIEILLMIHTDKLLNVPAILVMVVIVFINARTLRESDMYNALLRRFKLKRR